MLPLNMLFGPNRYQFGAQHVHSFLSHPKFFRQTLFLLILFPPFFPNNADGQLLQGIRRLELPDPCLANLPTPKVIPPAIRVVQLVNCSGQTVLGAANAANATGKPITSVFPVEKTWVMKPFPSPNHGNVLTIQIPPEWADTKGIGSIAPNIWVRTGCRFDVASDKAQCETGGAGGVYDTSKARLDRQAQPPSQSGPFIRPPHRRVAPHTTSTTLISARSTALV